MSRRTRFRLPPNQIRAHERRELAHLKNPKVLVFVRATRRLLHVLRSARMDTSPAWFWREVYRLVAEIHAVGLHLPKTTAYDLWRTHYRHDERLRGKAVQKMWSLVREYNLVFDPFETPAKPCTCLLWDDMLTIVQCLYEGLQLWNRRNPRYRLAAIRKWRFGIETKVSWRSIGLMRALHFYLTMLPTVDVFTERVPKKRKLPWKEYDVRTLYSKRARK